MLLSSATGDGPEARSIFALMANESQLVMDDYHRFSENCEH